MNILIVDDCVLNRELLRIQLEDEGHRVLEAAQGIEALEILDRESVDGVVSDILMPGMDGFQLCLEIRKRKNIARLPFVFYTGTFKSPQDQELARTVGADQYLTKPSTAREILGALEHAMQKTRDRIAMSAAQHDKTSVLKQYNASLVRKLEERNIEIEEALNNLQTAHDSTQESEQRFRAIFDHVGIGITMRPAHDRKLPWVQVNDHVCKLLGYTRDELLKLNTTDITPPDERAAAVSDNERLLGGAIASYSREKQVVRKDGRRIWVLLTVTSLPGPDGHPANLISTYQDITERKEADEKIKRLNRVYAVLSGITTLIVHVHDRDELFREACRIAIEEGQFPLAWIGVLDPATQDVIPVAWAGEGAEAMTKAKSSARDDIPQGQGAVGKAIRERRPVFNNDIIAHNFGGPRAKEIQRLGFGSQITLPLYEGPAIAATLTMYAQERNFFDEEELRLLVELAGDISFALENISSQKKLAKLARIRVVSSEINAAITRVRNRQELLDATCNIAVGQAGIPLAWIGMLDPATQDLKPAAMAGTLPKYAKLLSPSVRADISAGQGTNGRAFREKKPIVENDMAAFPNVGVERKEGFQHGIRAALSLPLLVEGASVGVMGLYAIEKGYFDDEEISLLTEVAGNISFALENIAKEEKIARLSRIQAVTGAINALIVRVRDRQELFDETCRIAAEHGGFGMVWIGLFDSTTLDVTPVAWAGYEANDEWIALKATTRDVPEGQGSIGRAVRERRPVVIKDMTLEPDLGDTRRREAIKRGYRSTIGLPLIVEGEIAGVFVLFAKETDFFNAEEVNLLTELAGNISFALEHMTKQQKIEKLSRIRAVSSEINAAIVRIREGHALLQEVCRIASDQGKFELVWIGTVNEEKQEIRPVAYTGFSPGAAHGVSWKSISAARGTLGEAVRTRKTTVRNDIETQIPVGGMRGEALQRGCRSTVCLPLVVDDSVVALMVLFAAGTGFFDKDELVLLDEVASDISFALEHIAKQKEIRILTDDNALQKQLKQAVEIAKEAADAANRAKGTFLAVMSHEIRTPLFGVLGMLELLSLTDLDPEQRRTLSVVLESGTSLQRIIDDILDFSKIEAGKLELSPAPNSIKEIVESTHRIYRGNASSKGLLLTCDVDPEISAALVVDPLRLAQIMNNFVSNAIKFTTVGTIEINAKLLGRAEGMETVRISIMDTGVGISAETQARLFQPFVQAAGETARHYGGTGLGLTICRRLADMMGGAIEMESEVGKGTTMTLTVTLPIADPEDVVRRDVQGAQDAPTARLTSRRTAPDVEEAAREGTLVLLVEDHPTNRELLCRQINASGYAAESAENGLQALDMWKSRRFALVITDGNMPEMDGYDLTRAIRKLEALEHRKRIPILACTANALADAPAACFAAGMDDYLSKPVALAELSKKLDQWLPLPVMSGARRTDGKPSQPSNIKAGPSGPVDQSVLAEICGGDATVERKILSRFRRANDGEAVKLREAVTKTDLVQVTHVSHSIKGSSLMLGAGELANVCECIERASRATDWNTIVANMGAFEHAVDRVNAYIDSMPPAVETA